MPIKYNNTSENMEEKITKEDINISIYCISGIIVIGLIYLIIKFKLKGLLISILQIGYIAAFLLILRYTQIIITLEGIIRNNTSYNGKLFVGLYDIEKF